VSETDRFQLIVSIVSQGHASPIVVAAKAAGARGGTIVRGRGSGVHEASRFFGVAIEPEKEVVLILIGRELTASVLDAMVKAGRLNEPGRGIAFVLDVPLVVGIAELLESGAAS
jgi:nitrogen regulatory protein P-II 1